ncbi:MAG: hypothetical protein A2840_01895 [Candidatus Buchananbacteria bacterium RIFCSPHIGHO2_01_FULL_47_11b]|uniref:Putative pterin-4-alpha-carbinolamine dehydratase n=1 Tax=Candidatus Buchananbacteria bacterium RIFCSPHIGHO2_01_FULL_47_11b TaxID=1797537 RepID=A0A1G1Y771_9BACT|nr:MAG: hypothetical protein A2840_01895 [Candidatus Buchananbacteria bacterium RIFCSPHIGHO2_01_FULL_47_11b]
MTNRDSKLSSQEIQQTLAALSSGWKAVGQTKINKTFGFENFKAAILFVNEVALLAEAAAHHPDIIINYSKVTLELSTHSARGLTVKDFELAKKIEALKLGRE